MQWIDPLQVDSKSILCAYLFSVDYDSSPRTDDYRVTPLGQLQQF